MNKCILSTILILLTTIPLMAQTGNASAGSLEERLQALHWQKRVLILYASDKRNEQYVKQKNLLTTQRNELEDRDLVLVELFANETDAATKNFLSEELKASSSKFNLLLIGKDGGVKYRAATVTPVEEVFSTIDAMPMRQDEMRNRRKPE